MSTNSIPVTIRRACVEDASMLSDFAARAFRDTFGPYTPPDDLAAYLAATYSPEQQAAEITDASGNVFLAEVSSQDGSPVLAGYVHISQTVAPAVVSGPDPIELRRLYVDTPWHGRGVAHRLMAEALRYAEMRGGRTMWLGVWENNVRAQAFYRRYGFERVGEHVFPVGSDPQVDWLLARPVIL